MKRHNKVFFVFLILIIITITGCNSVTNYQNSVFDDEDKIVEDKDSYTYKKRIGKTVENEIDLKFSSFTGIETINRIKVNEEKEIIFTFQSTIDDGDFKVVLITPEDEIINILEGTSEGTESITLKKGISKIKLVGKKAKGEVKINIQ